MPEYGMEDAVRELLSMISELSQELAIARMDNALLSEDIEKYREENARIRRELEEMTRLVLD